MYNWDDSIPKLEKDIAEYLEKRYEEYCKDRNEKDGIIWGGGVRERHQAKQSQLIELGIKLREKLSFWSDESRKELFEQAYNKLKTLDKFIMEKYDDFCKKLEETDKNSYTIYSEKTDKKKWFLNLKEMVGDKEFIEIIDKKRAEYEKKKAEVEKQQVEERAEEERIARKKGHSNIKPISFYERLYCRYGAPFGNKSFCINMDLYEMMQDDREWDIYFEVKGRPKEHDYRCPKGKPFRYKPDSPEDNKFYLDRCIQLLEVFKPFVDSDVDGESDFDGEIDIYQEYLDKSYLITRQIADLGKRIGKLFWYEIDDEARRRLSAFNKQEYKINIFDDDSFNLKEIKIKVNKFTGVEDGEVKILTPIESLKEYLKKHSNRITAREYSALKNISYKMALTILKKFVANKELKSKKEDRGLNIFHV